MMRALEISSAMSKTVHLSIPAKLKPLPNMLWDQDILEHTIVSILRSGSPTAIGLSVRGPNDGFEKPDR